MKASTICTLLLPAALFSVNSTANDLERQVEQEINETHWSGLPIWGDKLREMGYDLPIPVGFGIYMNSQDVEYVASDDFSVGAVGGVLDPRGKGSEYLIPAEDVSIKGQDKSIQMRLDAWVLPFLNLYVLAGYTKGDKDIVADLSNATRNGKPFSLDVALPLKLEYEAYNYGFGGVLATQFQVIDDVNPLIVTLAGATTRSNTTVTDSVIKTNIASLRVGQRYEVPHGKLAILLGYQYQKISQNISGSIDNLSAGGIDLAEQLEFNVDLENKDTSNMSLAAVYDFGPQNKWNIMAEYSFLNWNQLLISTGYRF